MQPALETTKLSITREQLLKLKRGSVVFILRKSGRKQMNFNLQKKQLKKTELSKLKKKTRNLTHQHLIELFQLLIEVLRYPKTQLKKQWKRNALGSIKLIITLHPNALSTRKVRSSTVKSIRKISVPTLEKRRAYLQTIQQPFFRLLTRVAKKT